MSGHVRKILVYDIATERYDRAPGRDNCRGSKKI